MRDSSRFVSNILSSSVCQDSSFASASHSAGDHVSAPQCCAFGRTPTLMSFDGSFMDASPLGQVPEKIHLVIVDLCAGKNTSVILRALQQCYPEPKTDLHKLVHVTLGVENLEITGRAVKLLREGDAKGLGELMTEVRRHPLKLIISLLISPRAQCNCETFEFSGSEQIRSDDTSMPGGADRASFAREPFHVHL
jgi:hypothetical protein